jgi:hypothetical protein
MEIASMISENVTESGSVEPEEPQSAESVDDRLGSAESLQLTGEGGLLHSPL